MDKNKSKSSSFLPIRSAIVRADSNGDGKVSRGRFAVLFDGQEQKQK